VAIGAVTVLIGLGVAWFMPRQLEARIRQFG
jgi:hypothetical protein